MSSIHLGDGIMPMVAETFPSLISPRSFEKADAEAPAISSRSRPAYLPPPAAEQREKESPGRCDSMAPRNHDCCLIQCKYNVTRMMRALLLDSRGVPAAAPLGIAPAPATPPRARQSTAAQFLPRTKARSSFQKRKCKRRQ